MAATSSDIMAKEIAKKLKTLKTTDRSMKKMAGELWRTRSNPELRRLMFDFLLFKPSSISLERRMEIIRNAVVPAAESFLFNEDFFDMVLDNTSSPNDICPLLTIFDFDINKEYLGKCLDTLLERIKQDKNPVSSSTILDVVRILLKTRRRWGIEVTGKYIQLFIDVFLDKTPMNNGESNLSILTENSYVFNSMLDYMTGGLTGEQLEQIVSAIIDSGSPSAVMVAIEKHLFNDEQKARLIEAGLLMHNPTNSPFYKNMYINCPCDNLELKERCLNALLDDTRKSRRTEYLQTLATAPYTRRKGKMDIPFSHMQKMLKTMCNVYKDVVTGLENGEYHTVELGKSLVGFVLSSVKNRFAFESEYDKKPHFLHNEAAAILDTLLEFPLPVERQAFKGREIQNKLMELFKIIDIAVDSVLTGDKTILDIVNASFSSSGLESPVNFALAFDKITGSVKNKTATDSVSKSDTLSDEDNVYRSSFIFQPGMRSRVLNKLRDTDDSGALCSTILSFFTEKNNGLNEPGEDEKEVLKRYFKILADEMVKKQWDRKFVDTLPEDVIKRFAPFIAGYFNDFNSTPDIAKQGIQSIIVRCFRNETNFLFLMFSGQLDNQLMEIESIRSEYSPKLRDGILGLFRHDTAPWWLDMGVFMQSCINFTNSPRNFSLMDKQAENLFKSVADYLRDNGGDVRAMNIVLKFFSSCCRKVLNDIKTNAIQIPEQIMDDITAMIGNRSGQIQGKGTSFDEMDYMMF